MDKFLASLVVLLIMLATAQADVPLLDVNAKACAIYSALTGAKSHLCPDLELGDTRSISRSAVPPSDITTKRGYYIHFAFGSDELTDDYQQHLSRLSDVIKSEDLKQLCLKLVGHTDEVGSASFNQVLSEQRSRAVRLYLVGAKGVSSSRIITDGRGEEQLIAGLDGRDARHRRVEVLAREPIHGSCLK